EVLDGGKLPLVRMLAETALVVLHRPERLLDRRGAVDSPVEVAGLRRIPTLLRDDVRDRRWSRCPIVDHRLRHPPAGAVDANHAPADRPRARTFASIRSIRSSSGSAATDLPSISTRSPRGSRRAAAR